MYIDEELIEGYEDFVKENMDEDVSELSDFTNQSPQDHSSYMTYEESSKQTEVEPISSSRYDDYSFDESLEESKGLNSASIFSLSRPSTVRKSDIKLESKFTRIHSTQETNLTQAKINHLSQKFLNKHVFKTFHEDSEIPEDSYFKKEFEYKELSEFVDFDNLKYQPFRHKLEICLWKIDTHNVAKIKSLYFTPNISGKLDNYNITLSYSLDKEVLMVLFHDPRFTRAEVLILDEDTFKIQSQTTVTWNITTRDLSKLRDRKPNSLFRKYLVSSTVPWIFAWNQGKYITVMDEVYSVQNAFKTFKTYEASSGTISYFHRTK